MVERLRRSGRKPATRDSSQRLDHSTSQSLLTAIIVAGGSSRRMGFDKTFAFLAGDAVVAHSIAAFEAADSVTEIILVGREDRNAELKEMVTRRAFRKVREVVAGGAHRHDSVRAGLECLGPESHYVAIHDAARPLVLPAQIDLVTLQARRHGAAALAAPVSDTLKRASDDLIVCGSIAREGAYAMQTPQVFLRELLLEAFRVAQKEKLSFTDEVSAVQHLGCEVVLVANTGLNLKITYPADLALAEAVLHQRVRSNE